MISSAALPRIHHPPQRGVKSFRCNCGRLLSFVGFVAGMSKLPAGRIYACFGCKRFLDMRLVDRTGERVLLAGNNMPDVLEFRHRSATL